MTALRFVCAAALLLSALLRPLPLRAADAPEDAPPLDPTDRPPLVLEELKPLDPQQPRTAEEADRLKASALFAAGRLEERRDNKLEALRLYERAHRYDPESVAIVRRIVPLAFQLNRAEEGVRYAVIGVELGLADAELLRKLGLHLTTRQEWSTAVRLYREAVELEKKKAGGKLKPGTLVLLAEMGRLYFVTEQYNEAAAAFDQVVDALENPEKYDLGDDVEKLLLGEADETYELFGSAYLEAGRLDKAAAMYRKAFDASEDRGLLGFNLARVAYRREKYDEALDRLQQYFDARRTSKGLAPYQLLADILEKQEQSDQLIARLEKVREHDESNVSLRYFLADAYADAGRHEKALELYQSLHEEQATANSYRGLARVYRETNQPRKLLALIGDIAKKTSSLETVADELAKIVADAKLVDRLQDAARKMLSDDEESFDAGTAVALALVLMETDQYDEAGRFFELAIKRDPDNASEVYRQWGLGMLLADQYERAVKVLRRAIDEGLSPEEESRFHYFLSMALAALDRYDEALRAADQAADKSDDDPVMLLRRPLVLMQAGRYGEARKNYLQILDKFEDDQSSRARSAVREARLNLSVLELKEGHDDRAAEWLEQVLDENPEDIRALNDLGYLWADRGIHLERALDMIRRAVEGDPDSAAYRDSLGWVLYRLGRYEEALKELKKAAELAGETVDGEILDHVGDAYHKLGRREQALETWKRALDKLDPDDPQDAERIEKLKEKLDKHSPKS